MSETLVMVAIKELLYYKIAPKVLMPRDNSASCIVAVMQTEAKHV